MRFEWNPLKNQALQTKRKLSFEESVEIFEHAYHLDQKNDDPEQWRVIGWSKGKLITLIFEVRDDHEGSYYWLITAWNSTKTEEKLFYEK